MDGRTGFSGDRKLTKFVKSYKDKKLGRDMIADVLKWHGAKKKKKQKKKS